MTTPSEAHERRIETERAHPIVDETMPGPPDVEYREIHQRTRIDGERTFAVLRKDKQSGECLGEKLRGSFDECDDYAQLNNSPDNYEQYRVVEVVA